MIKTDVLIVGGGIAGPALAAALADSELSVTLLERSADPLDTARGDHLQPRSVEILDRWGALPSLIQHQPERRAGTIWYDQHGEPLLEALVDQLDLPYPYFLFLNHELISQALLDAAAGNEQFKLLRPIRDWQIEQHDQTQLLATVNTGSQSFSIQARLLVGADGHNSAVRRFTGIGYQRERYQRPINVLFGQLNEPLTKHCLTPYLSDRGILAVIPRTGGQVKIGVAGDPAGTRQWRASTSSELHHRLRGYSPELPISDLRYAGIYPPARTHAEQWTEGNVVLIGDACHSMHPAQSQGMNVAIACVDQLAHCLREAGNDLVRALHRYEQQARPRIEPLLAANHQAGLLFDSTNPTALAGFADQLRSIQRDVTARHHYSLRSAGYPVSA